MTGDEEREKEKEDWPVVPVSHSHAFKGKRQLTRMRDDDAANERMQTNLFANWRWDERAQSCRSLTIIIARLA